MAVNYAEKYSQIVDERFKVGALTSALVNYAYDWVGVSTVKVFSVPTATMGDYKTEGANRYGTPAELENEVQDTNLYRVWKDARLERQLYNLIGLFTKRYEYVCL